MGRWIRGIFVGRWIARTDFLAGGRALGIDRAAERIRVARGSQSAHRNFCEGGIGEIDGAICESPAHRFNHPMYGFGVVPRFQFDGNEDIESFDRGDAAGTGGRTRDYLPIVTVEFVAGSQWLTNFGLVAREVVEGDQAAFALHFGG